MSNLAAAPRATYTKRAVHMGGRAPAIRLPKRPITTTGWIQKPERAWIYVGVSRRGRVKVGMSGVPERRCRNLHVAIFHLEEVVPEVAKEVETETLRRLGRLQHDGEWGWFSPDEAVRAVKAACAHVALRTRVDPNLTPEEARQQRVARALAEAE